LGKNNKTYLKLVNLLDTVGLTAETF